MMQAYMERKRAELKAKKARIAKEEEAKKAKADAEREKNAKAPQLPARKGKYANMGPTHSAKNGAKLVPKTMDIKVHKGERILNKAQTDKLAKLEKGGKVKLPKGDMRPAVIKPTTSKK